MDRAEGVLRTRFGLVVLATLAVAAALAVMLRFVQDDAFISYRYAENLIRGNGLVWEPGVAVQGYTNLLWTLLVAGGMALGLGPVVVSQVLSIGCLLVTLWLVIDLARRMTGSRAVAVGTAAFLLVNYTFVSYATGGLETMLQTMLVTAALWQTWRIVSGPAFTTGRLLTLSVLFGLAGLTRLDSAIYVAGLSAVVLATAWRHSGSAGATRSAVPLFAPGAIALAGYMAFSLGVYGDPLPNTFYAKTGAPSAEVIEGGVRFVLLFAAEYGIAFPAVLILSRLGGILRDPVSLGMLAIVVVWLAYLAWNGGGHMEFRLIVPVLPFLALLVARAWTDFAADMAPAPAARTAVVALAALAAMSVWHALTFGYVNGVDGIRNLRANLYSPSRDWVGIGERLGEVFPGGYEDGPSIAIRPAGAVPYHARLRTVDMLGLNDRWVAQNGKVVSTRPGHRLMAPLDYLIRREVNLVLSQPTMVERDEIAARRFCPSDFRLVWTPESPEEAAALGEAQVVALDINARYDLAMIYLTGHPAVEAALADGTLRQVQASLLQGCGMTPAMAVSASG